MSGVSERDSLILMLERAHLVLNELEAAGQRCRTRLNVVQTSSRSLRAGFLLPTSRERRSREVCGSRNLLPQTA